MTDKILLIDDDANILRGYQRQLRKQFEIETAQSGQEGLELLAARGPFAVIVSDMSMPGMNGVQFLVKARKVAPDAVRMMLTGNADQRTAIDAVNDGNIFRFLNKPCPSEMFAGAIDAGLSQYRLITAERELLTKTLSGTVQLLGEALSIVSPKGFGHVANVRQLVCQMAEHLHFDAVWQVEVAAIVTQMGRATMPESILEKVVHGSPLTGDELQSYRSHSTAGRDLIARVPRLGCVADVISYQCKRFDESARPGDSETQLGGQLLKVALDFDALRTIETSDEGALTEMQGRRGLYDPRCLEALCTVVRSGYAVQHVAVRALRDGMVLDEDVITQFENAVIVPEGTAVGPVLKDRLMRLLESARGVCEPIRVRVPTNALNASADGNTAPAEHASVVA